MNITQPPGAKSEFKNIIDGILNNYTLNNSQKLVFQSKKQTCTNTEEKNEKENEIDNNVDMDDFYTDIKSDKEQIKLKDSMLQEKKLIIHKERRQPGKYEARRSSKANLFASNDEFKQFKLQHAVHIESL
eukprot:gene12272-5856_t